MKNRNHGLIDKEMELVQLLMADCGSTGDIQATAKTAMGRKPKKQFSLKSHFPYFQKSQISNFSVKQELKKWVAG